MDVTLITAGIACIMAAIVGGGLKAFAIEIPALASQRRQLALGVFGVLLVAAGLQQRGVFTTTDQATPEAPPDAESAATTPSTPVGRSITPPGRSTAAFESCRPAWFGSPPGARVTVIESGAFDVELIGATDPKDTPVVVVVTEEGNAVGAVALRLYTPDILFKVTEVIDATCKPVETYRNETRSGGERGVLQNYDTMEVTFGPRSYALRLNYGSGRLDASLMRTSAATPQELSDRASLLPECRRWFSSPPPDRVRVVESGVDNAELLSADQPKDAPVVVVVTEDGKPVGAVALKVYTGNVLFKISQVVNARCEPLETFRNESGGDRRVLHNYDTLEMTFGTMKYSLRLGYGSGTLEGQLQRL